jgi:hypothetical protein
VDIEELMKPKPLSYYANFVPKHGVPLNEVHLRPEQCAAILKAHDHGICNLDPGEVGILDQLMSRLKTEIRQ